jgi:hypothetical protein
MKVWQFIIKQLRKELTILKIFQNLVHTSKKIKESYPNLEKKVHIRVLILHMKLQLPINNFLFIFL